ncbi:hypothetical protein B0H17DRAFT_1038610 [Mycena rosella]|uniref:Uncharacterized protein n=1 Tax=Mycena rosella TaxID=1033263 RepID=A0AAD7GT53_MYCRO|nr:hypothetical protein B0H17DRAFT_1038610 [Mycena rosella]
MIFGTCPGPGTPPFPGFACAHPHHRNVSPLPLTAPLPVCGLDAPQSSSAARLAPSGSAHVLRPPILPGRPLPRHSMGHKLTHTIQCFALRPWRQARHGPHSTPPPIRALRAARCCTARWSRTAAVTQPLATALTTCCRRRLPSRCVAVRHPWCCPPSSGPPVAFGGCSLRMFYPQMSFCALPTTPPLLSSSYGTGRITK